MGSDATRATLRQSTRAREHKMAWSEAVQPYKTLEDAIGGTPLVRLQRLPGEAGACLLYTSPSPRD